MGKLRVYLAGGIQGMSYQECIEWRDKVSQILAFYEIESMSPMRGKAFLQPEKSIKTSYEQNRMSTKAAIFARDKWDCLRADIVFVNLLGATRVSIGTMFEIAWAQDHGKYIIIAMEDENLHVHAFVQESASLIVPTLEEGIRHLLVVANVYDEESAKSLSIPKLA